MITEFVIKLAISIVAAVLGWVVDRMPTVPAFPTGWVEGAQTVAGGLATINNVVPVTFALACLGVVLAVLGVTVAIKLVRIVASFFTAGGGSAA